jgi:hypothetical protein
VNLLYVVDSIKKINTTSNTSMKGIKLISGSSEPACRERREKFMAMARAL